MRYHGYRPTRGRPRPGINREPLMHSLIVGTIVNRLRLRSKLRCGSAFFMGVKGGLVLPKFNDHEVVRPSDFLYDIHPGVSLLPLARDFPDPVDGLKNIGKRVGVAESEVTVAVLAKCGAPQAGNAGFVEKEIGEVL